MRYTTLIDITPWKHYRSSNCRLVYLHLVLIAGYHDNDRDEFRCSIRKLAADIGITVSATRYALSVLEKDQLIKRYRGSWYVRKWIPNQAISKRPTVKQSREMALARERELQNQERERLSAESRANAISREEYLKLKQAGLTNSIDDDE